ncbi:MAG: restriction endonuclease [Phycisphaerae bacterium]
MFPPSSRLWVVHISNSAKIAARARREGFICIGWTKMGNLAPHDTREKMKAAMHKAYPDWSSGSVNASYGQVFRFSHEMQVGDPIVYPVKGSREIMIGKVSGPYRWASDDRELVDGDYCNYRAVKWIKTVPRIAFSDAAIHSFGSFSSVSTSDEHLEEVVAVLEKHEGTVLPTVTGKVAPSKAQYGSELPVTVSESASKPKVEVAAPVADAPADAFNLAERAVEETKDYLLRQWSRTGTDFEEVVAAVFRAMGYTATTQQGTHDLGVDVIAHPDPLGVQPPILKIQCKSGTSTVGAPAVKQLRGLLNGPEKSILVSLGGFSNDARHVQQNDADLVLLDAERFVDLFLEHYERLAPEWRHRFPLTRVYVAAGK